MSDSLDDKLRGALREYAAEGSDNYGNDIDDRLDHILTDAQVIGAAHEDVIAQIKQAFTDAGYINLRGAISSSPDYQTATFRGDGKRMFTGKEWLKRFRAELDELPTYRDDQIEILKAAKRASGIDS